MSRRANKLRQSSNEVVLYARVSTAEQAEKDLSLPAQLSAMREYCDQRGLRVVDEFIEAGASGTDDNRPEFRKMLESVLAPSSKVALVLVYQTSRFMRNVAKARGAKESLKKSGIRVVAVTQETADDPMGRLIEGLFELIDQWESEVNGLRTRAALLENAKRGWFNGSRPPFGFRVERFEEKPNLFRGRLVPNTDEMGTHNEVFRLYVAGSGGKVTARSLNQRGLTYRGKPWSKDLVMKVIGEEAAVGTYYWGKKESATGILRDKSEWIALDVEQILDPELFAMAQKTRAERDPEKTPGRTGSSPLLLAGLVNCGKCGASYQLETSAKKLASGAKYTYRYYQCRNAVRSGDEVCKGNRIRMEQLDKSVLQHIAGKIFTVERVRAILEQVVEETGVFRQKTADQRKLIRQELAEAERRIARWQEAFETGEMHEAIGSDRLRELIHRRAELKDGLAKVVPIKPPPYLYTQANIERFQESLKDMFLSAENPMTRNYLRFLVEGITVTGASIEISARTDAALQLMAGDGKPPPEKIEAEGVNPSASSPTMGLDWLRQTGSNRRPSD